jgi:uncharacterized membrane protein
MNRSRDCAVKPVVRRHISKRRIKRWLGSVKMMRARHSMVINACNESIPVAHSLGGVDQIAAVMGCVYKVEQTFEGGKKDLTMR